MQKAYKVGFYTVGTGTGFEGSFPDRFLKLAEQRYTKSIDINGVKYEFRDLSKEGKCVRGYVSRLRYSDLPHAAAPGTGRFAPLTQTAVQILSKMKDAGSGSGLVFKSKYDAVQRCFTRACQRADIKDFRFHDLRHTAITRTHDRSEMQMLHLMQFTGHKSTQMVKRYYADNVDDVVSELNKKR